MHKLLQRQLKKSGAVVDEKFLALVNQAYIDADEDRELLERSLEISSQEMRELYEKLQKSTQEKIKQSEDKLNRLLYELRTQYFLYSYDTDFIITDVSASIEDILGYTPNEMIGTNFSKYYTDDAINKVSLDLAKKAIQGKETNSRIVSVQHKNGDIRYLEIDSYPLYDKNTQVSGVEGLAKDITQQFLLQQKLDYLSNHDSLTGLSNRHSLYNQLEYLIKDAKRHQQSFALFYIDLDNFKAINDILGHDEGDKLLQEFAHLLKAHARANDIVARIGGDEFILVYTDINEQTRDTLAQKLLESINSEITPKYKKYNLSASIGIATYPQDGTSMHQLLKSADSAMYKVKHSSKNSFANY